MPAISLRQIEIFHGVMTTGNLTEAALLLQTSQPTVSRELARFEQLVQLKLFDRVRGRLYPPCKACAYLKRFSAPIMGLIVLNRLPKGYANSNMRSFLLPACQYFLSHCFQRCVNLLLTAIRKLA